MGKAIRKLVIESIKSFCISREKFFAKHPWRKVLWIL